jgi:tetratricopeptide (TPR) repeat protein
MQIPQWAFPSVVAFHYNLGLGFRKLKWYDEALSRLDKAIALQPDYAEAYAHRGFILCMLTRFDDALASCDKAIALKPNYAKAYLFRGVVLTDKGRMKEAEEMFHKVLELQPDIADALSSLASIRKYKSADDPDVERIKALLDNPVTPLLDRNSLYFALGKIYDDCRMYDDAFACYEKANALSNDNMDVPYDPEKATRYTNEIIEVFTKDFLARPFVPDNQSSPIFIIGMPRSGTTLAAQMLSSHPSVASAGEILDMPNSTVRLPKLIKKRIRYPKAVKYVTPAIASTLIKAYEKRLRRDAGPNVPFVIDKHPLNFRHLGFIAMLFPKARIIHCTRNAMDTALSNYFQRFNSTFAYSFDLKNIAHFYGEYLKLIAHWKKVLPLPMMEIPYEDMVLNTEQVARKALDFLGLEWDPRCLTPHTNPSPVETSSSWQVRQPIYSQSMERWRHYEKHLGPLKEALDNVIRTYAGPATPGTSPRAQNA